MKGPAGHRTRPVLRKTYQPLTKVTSTPQGQHIYTQTLDLLQSVKKTLSENCTAASVVAYCFEYDPKKLEERIKSKQGGPLIIYEYERLPELCNYAILLANRNNVPSAVLGKKLAGDIEGIGEVLKSLPMLLRPWTEISEIIRRNEETKRKFECLKRCLNDIASVGDATGGAIGFTGRADVINRDCSPKEGIAGIRKRTLRQKIRRERRRG